MSLINKDFRTHDSYSARTGHSRLRWILFAIACITVGLIILNTSNSTTNTKLPALTSTPDHSDKTVAQTHKKSIQAPNFIHPVKTGNTHIKPEIHSPQADNTPATGARKKIALPLPAMHSQQNPTLENKKGNTSESLNWRTFTVKPGGNLARLFKRAGISAKQLDSLMKSGHDVKKLRHLYPRDVIQISSNDHGKLQALRYDINKTSYLMVKRENNQLQAKVYTRKLDIRTAHASGIIESSLFLAAKKAGVSQNIIMELASIFGWDIDFALDIRKGDRFTVLYEEVYHNGEKVADGNIIAAEFTNQGKTYQAVRYTNPQTNQSEYYSPDGRSMRKAFLRTPVKFTRISSRFSLYRYHPILHRFRAHKGVDYAAKTGTPVYAAGDGKVIFEGRQHGYGRVIILRHGAKYTTLYAHLNAFNRRVHLGGKVKQGQTIAYVGSSGLATGPHLHYEFRVNGVHRNPLTVKLPQSRPVPKRYRANFELMTTPMLAQLDSISRNQQIAFADTRPDNHSN